MLFLKVYTYEIKISLHYKLEYNTYSTKTIMNTKTSIIKWRISKYRNAHIDNSIIHAHTHTHKTPCSVCAYIILLFKSLYNQCKQTRAETVWDHLRITLRAGSSCGSTKWNLLCYSSIILHLLNIWITEWKKFHCNLGISQYLLIFWARKILRLFVYITLYFYIQHCIYKFIDRHTKFSKNCIFIIVQ